MIRKKKKPSTEGEQFNCLLSKNAQLTAGLMHLFTCNFEEANSRRNIKNLGEWHKLFFLAYGQALAQICTGNM
uniref:Uncharacterized protein n=1 Tax=Globodera rostochiensis TaxID=31243 RepID=A0A914HJD0_GLORO